MAAAVSCRVCRTAIPESGIDRVECCATCPACWALTRFEPGEAGPVPAAAMARRAPVPLSSIALPDGVSTEEHGGEVAIHLAWQHLVMQAGFLLPIVFAAIFWFVMRDQAIKAGGSTPLSGLVVPGVLFAIGVWGFLAYSLNRTTVRIGGGRLRIDHGPIPFGPGRTMPLADIAQLFCRRDVHRRTRRRAGAVRVSILGDDPSGQWVDYSLWVMDRSGRRSRLIASIPKPEDALALETLVEARLGIVDDPRLGDLRKPG